MRDFARLAVGLSIGAIPGLNVGSLEEYKDLYKITVYENLARGIYRFFYFRIKKGNPILSFYEK